MHDNIAYKMKEKDKSKNKNRHGEEKDTRFAAIETDPRFHRFPRSKTKVQVDERFAGACLLMC